MTENIIQTVKIKRILTECEGIKTLVFNIRNTPLFQSDIIPIPGQFVMIWVPGIDEIPMSLSGYNIEGDWSITVKKVGECTSALHNLEIGDYIGVRGPLGNGFTFPEEIIKNIFLIGGGIGMAPLKWLSLELIKLKKPINIIEGAKNHEELLFINELDSINNLKSKIIFCTDDGSFGSNELASDYFEKVIQKKPKEELSNSMVYTCGPEKMMYKIYKMCERNKISLQASLERIMKCGCGLCGLCALDPLGLLVCKDGPVFNLEFLSKMKDFGKLKRNFTGKKIPI